MDLTIRKKSARPPVRCGQDCDPDMAEGQVDDGTSGPVVPPTDTWGPVLRWLKDNPTGVIAILTALGFAMGGVILAAFAAGLGVAPTDLGLDLRATVTLAAGTLVYPAFLAMGPFVPVLGRPIVMIGYFTVIVLVTVWWIFGFASTSRFAVIAIASLVCLSAGSLWLLRRRGWFRTFRRSAGLSLRFFLIGIAVAAVLLPLSAFAFGDNVREDDSSGIASRIVQFVLPVTRGTVTVGSPSVCVDRIGTQVMMGDSSSAVVPEWDGFVVEDCERGDVSDLFD